MQDFFGSADFAYIWEEMLRLLRNPYDNLPVALLLLGVVVIVVLILTSIVLAIVLGRSPRGGKDADIAILQAYLAVLDGSETVSSQSVADALGQTARPRRSLRPWLTWVSLTLIALVLLGMALGLSTASDPVCEACHVETSHTRAVSEQVHDPHTPERCVSCHESSGWLGAATFEVPERFAHFANGALKDPGPSTYGDVASGACLRCHSAVARETTLDEQRGVRMSHKEPLAAGAECMECHTTRNGVVTSVTSGMTPCLRCHDDVALSAECSLCHIKDVSLSVASRTNPADLKGDTLVETPDCASCHDMAEECDGCHGGIRMPHSKVFTAYGHAREAVKDVWYNGGKGCATCHTAERRPCGKCHVFQPTASHGLEWAESHKISVGPEACTCHNEWAFVAGRDFCALCHQKPYVTQ